MRFVISFLCLFLPSTAMASSFASDSAGGQYLAAKVAERGLDIYNSASFYRRSLELDPQNDFLRIQAFNVFTLNGDFDLSIELAHYIIDNKEKLEVASDIYELALLVLASDSLKQKNYNQALKFLDYQWHQPLNKLAAAILQAWILSGLEKIEPALNVLEKLEGPLWFDLFRDYHSGLILLSVGDYERSSTYLQKAHKNSAAGRGAEETYKRITQFLSLSLAAKNLKQENNEQQPADLLARIKAGNIDYPAFTPIIGGTEMFFNLGTAVNREGGQNFAQGFFQLGNYLYPNSPFIMLELGFINAKANLLTRANEFFLQIPRSSNLWMLSRLQVATNLDTLGKDRQAKKLFTKLIAAAPDDSLPLLTLVHLNARHKRFGDSIPLLLNHIKRLGEDVDKNHWQLFYQLGIVYERTDKWQQAETYFQRALTLNPDSAEVLNYLGYSWVDMEINLTQALTLIEKAVALRPHDGYIVDSLGWAYYRLGRFDEAVEQLERALSLQPADPTINDHLGDAYWQVGRILEAKYQWRHALSFNPPTPEDVLQIKEKLAKGLETKNGQVSIKP